MERDGNQEGEAAARCRRLRARGEERSSQGTEHTGVALEENGAMEPRTPAAAPNKRPSSIARWSREALHPAVGLSTAGTALLFVRIGTRRPFRRGGGHSAGVICVTTRISESF
ncbi:MAG: hypothetical protein KatS3mg061_0735 [Dehalococcoidia bacterium]|nr:MAG: hypothetical protein KatS3mg061_0735 [Dehalococcoidia bacterium]